MAKKRRGRKLTRQELHNLAVVLELFFCFPLGLYNMWVKTRWSKYTKIVLTGMVTFALTIILMPSTNPPERMRGGIATVEAISAEQLLGPEVPEDFNAVEVIAPRRTALIVEPTATPQPIIVYCNPGGKYYHLKDCPSIAEREEGTPQATLEQAKNADYVACPRCNPPTK